MCGTWSRKLGRRSVAAGLDATHRLGGGAADDPDVAVAELDGQGGLGDQHGDGVPGVDAAEGEQPHPYAK
jgi:hypothetical protein